MTDVRFTVVQIIIVVAAGLIGTLLRQIPASAFQDPTQYASELADLHARYDPLTILGVHVGPSLVDVFLALGFFNIFSAVWFTSVLSLLAVSIIVCTLDRTPRLWRGVHDVHPTQPVPFFDGHLNGVERLAVQAPPTLRDAELAAVRDRRLRVGGWGGDPRPGAPDVGESFEGQVHVTHDAPTNSLVVVSSTGGALGFEAFALLCCRRLVMISSS